MLHRNVQPSNVMLAEAAEVSGATLVDFAAPCLSLLDLSDVERPLLLARYLSPEQAGALDRDVGDSSDLYSLGIVLHECLAGRPPYDGADVGAILRQHMTARVPDLRSQGLSVPRALDELVQRLLRKDPRDRYQSAEAVHSDLRTIVTELSRGSVEPTLTLGLQDRRQTLTEPAFVGREEELEQLDGFLRRAKAGEGGLAAVEAESGSGKTRLLAEVALPRHPTGDLGAPRQRPEPGGTATAADVRRNCCGVCRGDSFERRLGAAGSASVSGTTGKRSARHCRPWLHRWDAFGPRLWDRRLSASGARSTR